MKALKALTIPIHFDYDVITARQRARELLEQCGCAGTGLTLMSTVISEAARKIRTHSLPGEIYISISRRSWSKITTVSIRVHRASGTRGVGVSEDWKNIAGLTASESPEETVIQWIEELDSDEDEPDSPRSNILWAN